MAKRPTVSSIIRTAVPQAATSRLTLADGRVIDVPVEYPPIYPPVTLLFDGRSYISKGVAGARDAPIAGQQGFYDHDLAVRDPISRTPERTTLQPQEAARSHTTPATATPLPDAVVAEPAPLEKGDALGPVPHMLPELPELIVAGYGSPQTVDGEKHIIMRHALAEDLPRFLAHPRFRNVSLLHSNIQVGEILPKWTDPATGRIYTTHVDRIGLFVVIKIRTDPFRPPIIDKVIDDIKAGRLAAFSISADAPFEARRHVCAEGVCFYAIDKIFYYECAICEIPVNKQGRAAILSKAVLPSYSAVDQAEQIAESYLSKAYCTDGSCLLPPQDARMLTPRVTETIRKFLSPPRPIAPHNTAPEAEATGDTYQTTHIPPSPALTTSPNPGNRDAVLSRASLGDEALDPMTPRSHSPRQDDDHPPGPLPLDAVVTPGWPGTPPVAAHLLTSQAATGQPHPHGDPANTPASEDVTPDLAERVGIPPPVGDSSPPDVHLPGGVPDDVAQGQVRPGAMDMPQWYEAEAPVDGAPQSLAQRQRLLVDLPPNRSRPTFSPQGYGGILTRAYIAKDVCDEEGICPDAPQEDKAYGYDDPTTRWSLTKDDAMPDRPTVPVHGSVRQPSGMGKPRDQILQHIREHHGLSGSSASRLNGNELARMHALHHARHAEEIPAPHTHRDIGSQINRAPPPVKPGMAPSPAVSMPRVRPPSFSPAQRQRGPSTQGEFGKRKYIADPSVGQGPQGQPLHRGPDGGMYYIPEERGGGPAKPPEPQHGPRPYGDPQAENVYQPVGPVPPDWGEFREAGRIPFDRHNRASVLQAGWSAGYRYIFLHDGGWVAAKHNPPGGSGYLVLDPDERMIYSATPAHGQQTTPDMRRSADWPNLDNYSPYGGIDPPYRQAGYNQQSTEDDERQWLDKDEAPPTLGQMGIEEARTDPREYAQHPTDGDDPYVYGDPRLNNSTWRFASRRHRYVTSPDNGDTEVSKSDEANGQPAVRQGALIEGSDNPSTKPLSEPMKQAPIARPVTGSPVIMRAVAGALASTAIILKNRTARNLTARLVKGRTLRVSWTAKGWALDGLVLDPYFVRMRREATAKGHGDLANALGVVTERLRKASPLDGPTAVQVFNTLLDRANMLGVSLGAPPSTLNKSGSPSRMLAGFHNALHRVVRDPAARRQIDARMLAALDTLYEDVGHARDGLSLGTTVGLADGGDVGVAGDGPGEASLGYRGVETDIIDAVAPETYRKVGEADRLLRAARVTKAIVHAQADAGYCAQSKDEYQCQNCEHWLGTTTRCERVAGPLHPEGWCEWYESKDTPRTPAGNTFKTLFTDALLDNALDALTCEEPDFGPGSTFAVATDATARIDADKLPRAEGHTPIASQTDKANMGAEPPKKTPAHTGVMIAWYPTSGTADQLTATVESGEERDELHCTLVYLGDDAEAFAGKRPEIERILRTWTAATQPMNGAISGIGRFNPDKDGRSPVVALVDVPGLAAARSQLVDRLEQAGVSVPKDHDFTPHITLKYNPPGMDDMQERGIPKIEDTPITVDRVNLVWGGERVAFGLDDQGVTQITGESPATYFHKLSTG